MPTDNPDFGFVLWLTGLPASGKTTIASSLQAALRGRGVHALLLDSDRLREVLTPQPAYTDMERDRFYAAVVGLAELIARQGPPVIIAATGQRRRYRQAARDQVPRFLEVFVDCPLAICAKRDPKGLYAQATQQQISGLPGVDRAYEPPKAPELTIHSDQATAEQAAEQIMTKLLDRGWLD